MVTVLHAQTLTSLSTLLGLQVSSAHSDEAAPGTWCSIHRTSEQKLAAETMESWACRDPKIDSRSVLGSPRKSVCWEDRWAFLGGGKHKDPSYGEQA